MIRGAKTLLTADDLSAMGDRASRKELQEGELVDMSPAFSPHGVVASNIAFLVSRFVREQGQGKCFVAETGFLVAQDPDTVRAPDFAYVSTERLPGGKVPDGYFPGAPDLAVEVLSPSESASQIGRKIREYFAAGARAVWVADPESRTLRAYSDPTESKTYTIDDELLGGDVLPGFRCRVGEFFD